MDNKISCHRKISVLLLAIFYAVITSVSIEAKPRKRGLIIGVEKHIDAFPITEENIRSLNPEQNAHLWFGQMVQRGQMDLIIHPSDAKEFFSFLAKIAKSTMKEGGSISWIVISGHGSEVYPGFELVEPIGGNHVAYAQFLKNFLNLQDNLFKFKEELYLRRKKRLSGAKIPDDPELLKKIEEITKKMQETVQSLSDAEYISMAMEENAGISLAVCYSGRTDAHVEFAQNLGTMLMGKHGGAIIAAISASTLVFSNLNVDYWADFFGIDGEHREITWGTQSWWEDYYQHGDRKATAKMNWFAPNWRLIPIEKRTQPLAPLNVTFDKDYLVAEKSKEITLKPQVEVFPDSGELSYKWEGADFKQTGAGAILLGDAVQKPLQPITVTVKDKEGREGKGRVWIKGLDYEINIEVSEEKFKEGQTIEAKAVLTRGEALPDMAWHWKADKKIQISSPTAEKIKVTASGPGTLRLKLLDNYILERASVLAETSVSLRPEKGEAETENHELEERERREKEEADRERLAQKRAEKEEYEREKADEKMALEKRAKEEAVSVPQTPPPVAIPQPAGGVTEPSEDESFAEELEGTWRLLHDNVMTSVYVSVVRDRNSYTGTIIEVYHLGMRDIVLPESPFKEFYKIGNVILRVTRVGPNLYQGEVCRFKEGKSIWQKHSFAVKDGIFRVTDVAEQEGFSPNILGWKEQDSGELQGSWITQTGVFAPAEAGLRFSKNGNTYTGTITSKEGNDPMWDFRVGDVVFRLTRLSPHVYKGEQRISIQGKTDWASHTYGVKGDGLYVGDSITEQKPDSGRLLAQRGVAKTEAQPAPPQIPAEAKRIDVRVEKTSPASAPTVVGGKVRFKATVVSGSGEGIHFQWQPHPEVEFRPFEKSSTTTAIFRRPGTYKIYVQALKKEGPRNVTVGESNQLEVAVTNPAWKLSFDLQQPLIGEELRARIGLDLSKGVPAIDIKEMNFRWQLPQNARQTMTSPDDTEITFYLTDNRPAKISCLVSTKYHNDNLGGAGKTITAKSYNLTIIGPKPRQEFQEWKGDTQLGMAQAAGMKKVDVPFVTGQEILFSSKIDPTPPKPVSYNWTANPEGCTFLSNGGKSTSITCSSPGSYTVNVTAKMDGMEIGSATSSVTVTMQPGDFTSVKKPKEAAEAKKATAVKAPGTEPKPPSSKKDELEIAREELKAAFARYTKLATEGGKGNVEAALAAYKKALDRVEELEARASKTSVRKEQAPTVSPIRVGDSIPAPRKLVDAAPEYPEVAKSAGVQGAVILDAVIGTDGKVQDVRVIKSIPLLDQAAIETVRKWVFEPTIINGVAVPVITTVTVTFKLR